MADTHSLWTALALVLVIEGLLPFAAPAVWREAFRRMTALSDRGEIVTRRAGSTRDERHGARILRQCSFSARVEQTFTHQSLAHVLAAPFCLAGAVQANLRHDELKVPGALVDLHLRICRDAHPALQRR